MNVQTSFTVLFLLSLISVQALEIHTEATPVVTYNQSGSVNNTNTTIDPAAYNALYQQVVALNNSVNSLTWITSLPQFQSSNGVNLYNYMYKDCISHQNIFKAYQSGVFEKRGSPTNWDETTYASTLWNSQNILSIGNVVQTNGNGMLVHVPSGYNVLWLRVLNDRWATFRVVSGSTIYTDTTKAIYACGNRGIGETSCDGAAPDVYQLLHYWCPIPLYFPGDYMVYSDVNSDGWISGIAFGVNLWNHAKNSAVAYYWKLNGGTDITWNSANWNTDSLAQIPAGKVTDLYVPYVYSGKRKIVYLIEYNLNTVGVMHGSVKVNSQTVERLRTSYSNPFSTHWNSKLYARYVATTFTANVTKSTDKFIQLTIDMTSSNKDMFFREIGTHDYI